MVLFYAQKVTGKSCHYRIWEVPGLEVVKRERKHPQVLIPESYLGAPSVSIAAELGV